MKLKKILIIFGFVIFLIFVGSLLLLSYKKITQENIPEISVEVQDAEVSLFEYTAEDNIEITEEKNNIGNVNIIIDDEVISDQLGTNRILRQTYCNLKDSYCLLEVLIDRKGSNEILEDSELSLDYSYCKEYAKVWYLYDKVSKQKYLFENNIHSAQLSLNPIIKQDETGLYFEFDKMFYFAGRTDIDHYRINIDTLIALASSNSYINLEEYSTINTPSFTVDDIYKDIIAEKDLNGDGTLDLINLTIYNNANDLNKVGFSLNINNSNISIKNASTMPTINFIDIDKKDKFKEIVIVSADENEPSIQYVKIYYYDGNNINLVYNGTLTGYIFPQTAEINELDLTLDSNNSIVLNMLESDSVQTWNIDKVYKLNEKHVLYEAIPDYYKNKDEQKITARRDIVLYDAMDMNAKSEKPLNFGEEVKLMGANFNYWFVINRNDKIYYISLDNDGTIKDLGLYPNQVFTGLNATD